MIRLVLLSMIAFYVTPGISLAEKIGPAQQLQYFGNRMVQGTWNQELPSEAAGSRHTYKWALGNSFVVRYMRNQNMADAMEVGGVDPKTQLQTWWSFQDDGTVNVNRLDVERISPNLDRVMIVDEDIASQGVVDVVWDDEDTILLKPKSGTDARGEQLVGEKWKRNKEDTDDLAWINSEQPATTPDQMWLARHTTGKKWIDGVMPDGSKFLGAGHGKWILNGKFHVYTGSTASDDQTAWSHLVITGIDPSTKKVASWEFTTLGATNYITYDPSGQTIMGEGMLPDGSKHSFKGRFEIDGDVLRYKSKISLKGDEAKPYGWNYRNAD